MCGNGSAGLREPRLNARRTSRCSALVSRIVPRGRIKETAGDAEGGAGLRASLHYCLFASFSIRWLLTATLLKVMDLLNLVRCLSWRVMTRRSSCSHWSQGAPSTHKEHHGMSDYLTCVPLGGLCFIGLSGWTVVMFIPINLTSKLILCPHIWLYFETFYWFSVAALRTMVQFHLVLYGWFYVLSTERNCNVT